MILQLIFGILVFGIALALAAQGTFSALIMTVLTILCAAGAICWHDWLAANLLAPYWRPDFAHPLALAASFGVALIVLRLIFDKLIRRQCLLPLWIDRAGGGICGFITGQIMVGVMALAVQMIPFDGGFLGYARVTRGTPDASERELWLKSDRFAAATASLLSGGILSETRSFYADHPDLVSSIGWVNSPPLGIARFAKPASIRFISSDVVPTLYRQIAGNEREKLPPTYEAIESNKSGRELRMVRIALTREARDEANTHLFAPRQFRLVGRTSGDGLVEQYFPVALQQADATQTTNRHIRLLKEKSGDVPIVDETFVPRGTDDQVEMVFELPKGFEPSFIEYKRSARVAVNFSASAKPKDQPPPEPAAPAEATPSPPPSERRGETSSPGGRRGRQHERPPAAQPAPTTPAPPSPAPAPTDSGASAGTVPNSGRGGNVRRNTTRTGQSAFGDQLPVELRAYRRIGDSEVERGALLAGHLVGEIDKQSSGGDNPVARFAVPEDKRLLQLHTSFLEARSGLGKALSRAISVAQNYTVLSEGGTAYPLVGKYAIADVSGTRVIEVQYASEERGMIGASMGPFNRIKDDDLKGDYEFVLLFHVDPGARIIAFSTGGDATRRDDLTGENLVAPH